MKLNGKGNQSQLTMKTENMRVAQQLIIHNETEKSELIVGGVSI